MLSCLRTELQRQFTLSLEKGTIRRMNVWHRLAEQFCQPTGFAGRFVGFLFRMNREGVDKRPGGTPEPSGPAASS